MRNKLEIKQDFSFTEGLPYRRSDPFFYVTTSDLDPDSLILGLSSLDAVVDPHKSTKHLIIGDDEPRLLDSPLDVTVIADAQNTPIVRQGYDLICSNDLSIKIENFRGKLEGSLYSSCGISGSVIFCGAPRPNLVELIRVKGVVEFIRTEYQKALRSLKESENPRY